MTESTAESSTETILDVAKTGRIRVLHVDDDLTFLSIAKQCLEMQGEIDVDTVSSVNEASEELKKTDYDAIVSDYQMPDKDGLEFLKELREKGNTVPFIVFTGKGREEVAIKALNLGADQYMDKTGDPGTVYYELAHNIRQVVEKKRASEMRNVCQQRFLCLVENAAVGIGIFDPQGRFTYVNDALANLLGYRARELAGRHFSDFLHKEDKARILESFRQFSELETEPPTLEFRVVRKDGRLAYLMAKPTKYEIDGKIVGSQAIIVDITERKKMEQDLVDNQERLQRILSASPDAITVSDMNGNIVECNQATLDILELSSKEELIGKSGFEFIPKKDHQRVRENLGRALEQGSVKNVEYAFLTKSGREIPTELSSSVLKDSSGKIVGFVSVTKDVTERKKAEEIIKKSNEEWKRTFDAFTDFVFIVDKDYRLVRVNRALCDALNEEPKELIGKRCFEVLHGSDKPWPNCPHKKTLATRKAATEEIDDPNLGMALLVTDSPIFDDAGELVGTVQLATNIAERKKAEDRLRESEEKYRTLFQAMREGVIVRGPDGKILSGNSAAAAIFGYEKPEELVGMSTSELYVDNNQRKTVLEELRKKGHVTDLEVAVKKKDGTRIYVSSSIASHNDGSGNILQTGIFRDITERKKAEEELKSSEQKFRGLVEDSAAAIATTDLKGRLTYVNKALADSLGYSIQEMSGRAFKEFLHPDDRGRLVRLFLKSIVLRRQLRKFEFRALRKGGAVLHLMCRPTRLETAGETRGFQAIIIDNTAEKRMLEKVEKMNEKLSVVGGLTRHDVNNKLSVILNVSYLFKQKLRDNQSLELVKETESAVHQIEGLFEFARIYEKLGTEELVYVDAEKVFKEAAMLFPSLHGIKIVNDCHGLTVFADSLLRQLFYNLIDNSLKHGEKVSQVRVHYQTREDHLKLIYEDDGIGIPDNMRSNLFKEGFTSGKGTGHGLFMIKRICEVYGWALREIGTRGKGARFIFTIPEESQQGKLLYKLP